MRRGVDFDGTLALYESFEGPGVLGEPIPLMVERVRKWLANGDEIAILTARAYPPGAPDSLIAEEAIKKWCMTHFGQELEVTCMKDYLMEEIWDDRAIRVRVNTGEVEGPMPVESAQIATYDMLKEEVEW